MSHFHVILQEIFHNLSIFQFSVSQILSFSDFQFLRFYFGRSGYAVGLSAISLLAFSRIPHPVDAASHVLQFPSSH